MNGFDDRSLRPWMLEVVDYLAEATRRDRHGEVLASVLRDGFTAWRERTSGAESMSARRFAVALRALGYKPHKRSVMYWTGLALREDQGGQGGESDIP